MSLINDLIKQSVVQSLLACSSKTSDCFIRVFQSFIHMYHITTQYCPAPTAYDTYMHMHVHQKLYTHNLAEYYITACILLRCLMIQICG